MNSIEKSAGDEIDLRVRKYLRDHGMKAKEYPKAYQKVIAADRALRRRYAYADDDSTVKSYADTLPPARRALVELQGDVEKTRLLAGRLLTDLAKQRLVNVGGVPNPLDALRRAFVDVQREYPTLNRAAADGFISDNDFQLVGMLIPAVQGEIEKGRYSRTESTRCQCGENKAYCRGKKLAARRGVHEDAVQAFAQCIKDAQMHGDQLDAIACYFR